jgi:hypothetical protein
MKISGKVIQNRNIKKHTKDEFFATYKGKDIEITTDHRHGEPDYPWLKRYSIYVTDIKTGLLDVQIFKDHHCIKDAIRYALKGACLL